MNVQDALRVQQAVFNQDPECRIVSNVQEEHFQHQILLLYAHIAHLGHFLLVERLYVPIARQANIPPRTEALCQGAGVKVVLPDHSQQELVSVRQTLAHRA